MSCWKNLVCMTELPLEEFPSNWNELRKLFDQLDTHVTKDNERLIGILMLYLVAFGQPLRLNQVAEVYQLPLSLQIEASYYVSIDRGVPQKVSLALLQGFLLRDRIIGTISSATGDLDSIVESLRSDPNVPRLYLREYMEFLSAGEIKANNKPITREFYGLDEQFLTNWSLPSLERISMDRDDKTLRIQAKSLKPPQLEAEKPLQAPSTLMSPARISTKSRLATENLSTPTSSSDTLPLIGRQNSSSQTTTPTKAPTTLRFRKRRTRKNKKRPNTSEDTTQQVKTPERPIMTTHVESPGKYSFRTSTLMQMKSPSK